MYNSGIGTPYWFEWEIGILECLNMLQDTSIESVILHEYSCAMKSHFRKFGNQMSGSGNHLCNYASLLA